MKKLVAITLVLVMVLSLCACGGEKTGSSVPNDVGLSLDNKLELTVWQTQGTDYIGKEVVKDDVVNAWLLDKTNTEVTNMYGNGGGQWDAKLAKLVAGGNLPDIVQCGGGQGPAHFTKIRDLGQLWELTPELLEKYAPNAWARIPQSTWDAMTVDGKILGIPFNVPESAETLPAATEEDVEFLLNSKTVPITSVTVQQQCLWVRDDILKMIYPEAKSYNELVALLEEKGEPIGDELMDIPIYTTQDYIDFMYKIRDLGLKTENGKTVYATGYNGSDNWYSLSWLGAYMYGYIHHFYTGTWNSEEKAIDIMLDGDLMKEAARTQNQMVLDGVIEKESLAHTAAVYNEKALGGQYAIFPVDYVGSAHTVNSSLEEQGKPYRYRPFITHVPAAKGYEPYKTEKKWIESLCFTKTLSEQEVIQALNWLDTQFSDEFDDIRNWGPKEAGLYKEVDGKRTFVDERFNKFFIEGDESALDIQETKGLGGTVSTANHRVICDLSRWTPSVHARYQQLVPDMGSGFKFTVNSPYVTNVKNYPNVQGWDAEYSAIPEVITFWAERDPWENGFKLALAAEEGKFDEKWDAAVATLNSIVDVKAMEKNMTEIAKELFKGYED